MTYHPDATNMIDERTREKVHKHLSDINDQITDEDIMNAITDFNTTEGMNGINEAREIEFQMLQK